MTARLAAAVGIATAALAGPAGAADWTLERVMAALAAADKPTVRYVEERRMSFMTEPVVVTGTLSYRDGVLEKTVGKPKPEKMVIEGDRMRVSSPGNKAGHTVYLADFPALGAFVSSLRATLKGDVAALRQRFWIEFKAKGPDWTLVLQPLEDTVRDDVSDVTIAGADGRIASLTLNEANGDSTTVKILED